MEDQKELIRDYSLVGVETEKAIAMGLAEAEWYQSPVPEALMRELLIRKDGPAIRDTLLWFGLILGSGYLFFILWGTWWAILPYIVYSVLYASTSYSRWHEAGHGTAFKTDWMNNVLYEIASFMVFRQSSAWRWSHARHHSDTIIRGRDPEMVFVCGHAQQNIEVMCDCRPDNVSIDENIPLDYVRQVALNKGVSFGGNIKVTSVLLLGDETYCKKEAVECIDFAGDRGFALAPGCDLPMDTPVENLQAVIGVIYDDYTRQVIREMEHHSALQPLSLNNHFKEGKIRTDIITLDSASCTPCQYMVEAVKSASVGFGDKVIINEHKIKNVDGIRMMLALGVQNVPTTCIGGKVKFVSHIPPNSEIIKALEKALN